jgi:aminopeptidase N
MPNFKMPGFIVSILLFVMILGGCSDPGQPETSTTEAAAVVKAIAPPGRLDKTVVPTHYRLELRVDPTQNNFSGQVEIDVDFNEATSQFWLHGKNIEVSEAYLTDQNSRRIEAVYEQKLESGVALVSLVEPVDPGSATLSFQYTAPFNTSTNALFRMERGEDSYVASQLESTGARQVFPGFDEPGFKVPFDLTVFAPESDQVISSTPELSAVQEDDGWVRHEFQTTRPLPTYLLAFAVGPYEVVDYGVLPANSIRDRELVLRGVTARGLGSQIAFALKHTEGLLTTLEDYFGLPYPYAKLDLIAVPESFGGAMENPGAITFDEYIVLMDEDSPISQRRVYTYVNAHELAHMWFGNLVTPEWWNDIWLNEAFASWMMYKTADSYWPEGEFDRETLKGALNAMGGDSLAAARQVREPVETNEQISDAFDGITYQKGGGVLAMLERYVGEEEFKAGVRLYMNQHTDSTATADDFMASLAEGSGRSELESAFRTFIEQPGVPLVSAQVNCDDEKNPVLEVSQTRYAPLGSAIDAHASVWKIPMCVSYLADGSQQSTCVLLNESKQTLQLESDQCPTRVHPNADGAGYYRFSLDETWWQGLIADSAEISPPEALVMADSLDAAFRAGVLDAKTYVAGLAALVNHDSWDVAQAAMDHLEKVTGIFESAELESVEQALRKIVLPRYAKLADSSDTGSVLLRQRMQRFLIVVAKDQGMRKPLAEQATARIGLDGEPDLDAAPASELQTIFSVGVQDIGKPFFDLLLEQAIASEDPAFRSAATGALARVEDPELVRELQDTLLGGVFRGTEFSRMVGRQMARIGTTELTFNWLKEHDDAIIEMFPGSFRSRQVPALGNSFCEEQKADEWKMFIRSNSDQLAGFERTLDKATESIHLCAALREAKSQELITAFQELE